MDNIILKAKCMSVQVHEDVLDDNKSDTGTNMFQVMMTGETGVPDTNSEYCLMFKGEYDGKLIPGKEYKITISEV
jgi:hypothetical protein